MKVSPIRDVLFIVLAILLIAGVVFSAFHTFDKPASAQIEHKLLAPTATPLPTPTATPTLPLVPASLSIADTQWGQSTCYIGATEGSSRFSVADMQDLGINVYHIYGGMGRWEAKDDSKVYGTPTCQVPGKIDSGRSKPERDQRHGRE